MAMRLHLICSVELIAIALIVALSLRISLAGARAILGAFLFLMMRSIVREQAETALETVPALQKFAC
jgi:hypothetical protein